jgi:putative restriction endonuclease
MIAMATRKWTREELILAFNLYCKIPFGQIHNRNPQIIELASLIQRSPSAVSWKLANFARLDPILQKRSIGGASHGSKADIDIWNEFNSDWDSLAYESEKLLAKLTSKSLIHAIENEGDILPKEGKDREAVVRVRVNQAFFRSMVLAAHNHQCCITGLSIVELLNASHIVPWSKDKENRVNPQNGICLNALHDRAFDRGFITVLPNFTVKVSKHIKDIKTDDAAIRFLKDYDGSKIRLPNRFLPQSEFLIYHNQNVFKDGGK